MGEAPHRVGGGEELTKKKKLILRVRMNLNLGGEKKPFAGGRTSSWKPVTRMSLRKVLQELKEKNRGRAGAGRFSEQTGKRNARI